jgi:hypothetical protein
VPFVDGEKQFSIKHCIYVLKKKDATLRSIIALDPAIDITSRKIVDVSIFEPLMKNNCDLGMKNIKRINKRYPSWATSARCAIQSNQSKMSVKETWINDTGK